MIQALVNLSPYASQMALVALGLAFVVAMGILGLSNYAIRRAARRRALAPNTPVTIGDRPYPLTIVERGKRYIRELGRIKRRLAGLWTGFGEDDLSQSFQKSLGILKTYLGDQNFKYRVPWYLMIGEENSGKSTILNTTGLDLPIGRPDFSFSQPKPALDWWFYDNGIVMDLAGDIVLENEKGEYKQPLWQQFLNLLNRFRPQRPLDGVLLTIPATDIYGPKALTKEQQLKKAKAIHERLFLLQNTIGMRLPIYVIVTKTDAVEGFKSFVQELPDDSLNQILGWSSPHNTDTGYAPQWINSLFSSLQSQLREARAMIYAQTTARDQQYRDKALAFPAQLAQTKSGIQTILDHVFKETAFHDMFFLRGVYFTGDNYIPDLSSDAENVAEAQDRPGAAPVFIQDLLRKKIFPEAGLGQPIRRLLVSTSRKLNVAKVAVALFSVYWLNGLMMVKSEFATTRKQLIPALEKVNRTLEGAMRLSSYAQKPQLDMYLNQQTDDLIRLMSEVNPMTLNRILVPGSWSGGLDQKIRKAFTIAYDQIILKALSTELMKKASALTDSNTVVLGQKRGQGDVNPLNLTAFKNLNNYVRAIDALEANVRRYNDLEHTQSLTDLSNLIQFLYGRTPPAEFFEQQHYYGRVLSGVQDKNINIRPFREQAQKKLRLLATAFAEDAFRLEMNFPALIKATQHLERLMRPSAEATIGDLKTILSQAQGLKTLLDSDRVSWIEKARFEPGQDYNSMLTTVARADLFGLSIAEDLSQDFDKRFKSFKGELAGVKTTLAGRMLKVENGALSAAPSAKYEGILTALQAFLELPFMAPQANQRSIVSVPPGKLLLWDEVTLQTTMGLVDEYNAYVTGDLLTVNPEMRAIFKVVARNTVRSKIINAVARSQVYVDDPSDTMTFGRRDILANQVQNFKGVTPIFSKLLGTFEGGGFILTSAGIRELLIAQGYGILRKADRILQAENFYDPKGSDFTWWNGEKDLGFQAFGVYDEDGLNTYFAAQRDSISQLAKTIAEPVLSFLSLGYLEKNPDDLPLVVMWRRIIKQLDGFANQAPENSVGQLEKYVLQGLNGIQLSKCASETPFKGGDYFLEKRRRIQTLVQKQCLYLANEKLQKSYNSMANFFNVSLAGKYPFVDADSVGGGEADPEDVNKFIKLINMVGPSDEHALALGAKTSKSKEKALGFIRQVKTLVPLLRAALDQSYDESIPQVDFTVEFRTNRAQENLVNQLVDYNIGAGNVLLSRRSEKNAGAWQSGDEVKIQLQLAENSNYALGEDEDQPALSIEGSKAIFKYSGTWGLIRLLQNHQIVMPNPQPGVFRLRFTVPTQFRGGGEQQGFGPDNQKISFFMDLTFALGDAGVPLENQPKSYRFPVRAPIVPSFGGGE